VAEWDEPFRSVDVDERSDGFWVVLVAADGAITEDGPHRDQRAAWESIHVLTYGRYPGTEPPWFPRLDAAHTYPLGYSHLRWGWGAQAAGPNGDAIRSVGVTAGGVVACYDGHVRLAAGTTENPEVAAEAWMRGADIDTVTAMLPGPVSHRDDDMRPEVRLNWDYYASDDHLRYRDADEPILKALAGHPLLSRYYVYVGLQGIDISTYSGPDGETGGWLHVSVPWDRGQPDDPFRGLKGRFQILAVVRDLGDWADDTAAWTRALEERTEAFFDDRDPNDTLIVATPADGLRAVCFDELIGVCEEHLPAGQLGAIPAPPPSRRRW